MGNSIVIKGAREHNLKNIDVEIPRDKLVVITGLSGSGKSSLAFDTIYAEGQRRYVESLSAYARQFLEQMGKPDVDSIEGLSPAISIEQKSTSHNPRSTVGTVTEIYDYLRLLFARVGHPYCFQCGEEIAAQTVQQMVDAIASLPEGEKFQILAPIVRGRKGEYRKELLEMRKAGYVRARVDGKIVDLGEDITLDKQKKHTIEIIVDRLVIKAGDALMRRLADSVETSVKLTGGLVGVLTEDGQTKLYSDRLACIKCGVSYPEVTPRVFSFNSPHGACPACDGIGYAVTPGCPEEEDFTLLESCDVCHGARLRPESLSIKLAKKSIAEVTSLSVRTAADFFHSLKFSDRELVIAHRILKEIRERLGFLVNVGLDYLTLDRAAATLSGGEGQRIRLATQIGSGLVGVLYILDEPSIGLHQRDNRRLLQTLLRLRDLGNTVVVVEHDAETMQAADHILDMGPGAGSQGGHVIAQGTPQHVMGDPNSLTGQYLRGIQTVSVPLRQRKPRGTLSVVGAQKHNLKNVTARIPLGLFTCVTGVSGSGKSTLVLEVLFHSLSQLLYHKKPKIDGCKDMRGVDALDKVIDIDQSPIGRTPRSNPATYTGLFGYIRDLYSNLPESRVRGYKPGRYSFNVKGGRCEACQGDGLIKIEMHFLPDVYVTCEVCKGQRYNRETLEILHKGKSIADVLNMTVDDALEFFEHIPLIKTKLQTLHDVGLHYVKLGQSATTLSGGEAQRVKLSRELSKRATGRTMYILDEPTTGLHFADVQRLLDVLDRLVEAGNTVLVIEHNLDVIKNADWIIDLGPEGGDRGGEIVAEGSPKEIAKAKRSYTGQVLKEAGL
ncbi:MAG: excinuclease ABC subunit UvrA [Nitrospira sp.]|nr:excinuclease ABC subunit UvrA [Nitrospira sp.]MDH4368224.1 excinuclease ABC subunit UvrA [Nitrospira sp.]MDH5347139.1 excinuclease ABC subunit UvrA [Nitrospira sp.]MDH5495868.1 excinuclease ABC subunit UvrA [Nitrospira sp.]MDH5725541.1 excinuclease ABC subunit UvrA [Nitrospira sp.]